MTIRIHDGQIYRFDMQTRMPFRYGIATLTRLPHAFVRLEVEVDGTTCVGIAADHLPPKWFTKDPDKPPADEIDEMLRVVRQALALARGQDADSAFALWQRLYAAQASWGREQNLAPLLTHFGVTLVERALIEAVCRAKGAAFGDLLRANAFGVRLGAIHPALAGSAPADLLPERPLRRVFARHTVGLSDPITDADIAPEERLEDGLPQSLEACIAFYGLRHFKIKVNGDLERDLDRLHRMAAVIQAHASPDFAFSLDGNEQFKSLETFRGFWEAVQASPTLAGFIRHLLFVEQPLHRDVALSDEAGAAFAAWPDRPPTIIDESDATLESLPTALRLGYAGTSHKNCKGVFKGIANACLLERRRRTEPGRPSLLSGEDLSNVGPVALLQDLAVQANLGIESIERNGQHYFAGLSMFPEAVQRQVLDAHSDLYALSAQGWPAVRIEAGCLDLGTVLAAPLGVGFALDVRQFTPAT